MSQAEFRAALLDPDRAVPDGLLNQAAGGVAGGRFDVYRNNVVVGLKDALAQSFPAVRKLVGAEFFDRMAGVFIRAFPPPSPIMPIYGGDFPGFLADFAPVAHLGYLPDVARLELLLRQSYHAADASAMTAADWAAVSPDDLARGRLRFVASACLLRSDWPVLSIWRANMRDGQAPAARRPEDILIARADYDPEPLAPPDGAGPVLAALFAGTPFSDALDLSGPGFDLSAFISFLVSTPVCQALDTDT